MFNDNLDILYRNCTTFREQKEMKDFVMESAQNRATLTNKVNIKMVDAFLAKSDIDFGAIPESRGRIDRFIGFEALTASLEILESQEAKNKNGSTTEIIQTAIASIMSLANKFELAFKVDNQTLMLMYNTLVAAAVQGTSMLIGEMLMSDGKALNSKGKLDPHNRSRCVELLADFNKKMENPAMMRDINMILGGNKNLLGGVSMAIVIAASFMAIVPILRELVYLYYNSRMVVSDFIDQQVYFVQMNQRNLGADSTMTSQKRRMVEMKQQSIVKKLTGISDKIRVDHSMAINKADSAIKSDNKKWTLDKVEMSDTRDFTF